MNECLESVRIIQLCIISLKVIVLVIVYSEVMIFLKDNRKITTADKKDYSLTMEVLVYYYILYTEGYTLPHGYTYVRHEAPKGELACLVISNNLKDTTRVKIKCPD